MGKSTISMAIFNSYVTNYQRLLIFWWQSMFQLFQLHLARVHRVVTGSQTSLTALSMGPAKAGASSPTCHLT